MTASGETDPKPAETGTRAKARKHLPPLPLVVRLAVLVVGWIVVLIGVAGLALPGIQGCLTIALGAALLSLASEMIYRGLNRLLHRWPKVWDRVESFRAWTHAKLSRSGRKRAD